MLRSVDSSLALRLWAAALALLFLFSLAGCGGSDDVAPSAMTRHTAESLSALPLDSDDLIAGRETWLRTCSACHLSGLTGAPVIGDKRAWKPRIEQGLETLYRHALEGFIGPDYTEMPAKGGFLELSDDEVKQAVRFVVFASE